MDDLVWVYSKRKVPNKPTKITDGWTGPYRIVGRPAEVLLDVTTAGTGGSTTTIHVARATKVRSENPEGRQLFNQQEAVDDDDADEIKEDLALPSKFFEPNDVLLTSVPVKTAPEPPPIRDLPAQKAPIRARLEEATPDVGAGPSGAQSTSDTLAGHTKKRALAPTSADEGPDDGKQ